MKQNSTKWFFAAIIVFAANTSAQARELPIYIEDSHAGTFYWLAQHVDLDQPYTLIHFDAHSDASAIFDSDNLRTALRNAVSMDERTGLLDRLRRTGRVQCFNWIEPLMPAPIARVIWVPGDKLDTPEIDKRVKPAVALLDGHLEAAPRKSGSFRDRYSVRDFESLAADLDDATPLIITIDLDYFAGMTPEKQADTFARVWNFTVERPNLRAISFAISCPYLNGKAQADQLVERALTAAFSVPTAEIEFEPFQSVPNDRSSRADEFRKRGIALPTYDVTQAPEKLRAMILAEKSRIIVQHDRQRWEDLLGDWENEAPKLTLALKDRQPSTDGVWRVPADQSVEIQLRTEPWLTRPAQVEWFALVPKYTRCNVTNLSSSQVGFVADAAPRPVWEEVRLPHSTLTLPIAKLEHYFEPRLHCGSLRLRARANLNGRMRQTPVIEVRRLVNNGFRAALSEEFGLPYLFGSGELSLGANSGPEINLGADCANFVIFALRRDGRPIPWSDPKGLRANLTRIASSVHEGQVHVTPADLDRGLIVDLGTHVAAVMEDVPPFGILDENDLVAHQLKGTPQVLTLGELLRDRKMNSFDLLEPRTSNSQTLLFGGDVMLGRSCAAKIERGLNPFGGIEQLFSGGSFVAANLECTISDLEEPAGSKKYSFRAPRRAAKSLAAAGFRVMGLANNHAQDFGHEALRDCMLNLSREKVETAGVGATTDEAFMPKFFSIPGENRIALLAIDDLGSKGSPGGELATASDRVRLKAAIETARGQANFIVCLVHWGIENTPMVTEEQRELGRWLVNQGVDAVIGSHPHCVQPLDFYHGCPIAYSLGNFVFDGAPNVASWNHGALLEIGLAPRGKVTAVHAISIDLRDGLPEVSAGQETSVQAQGPPRFEIAGDQHRQ